MTMLTVFAVAVLVSFLSAVFFLYFALAVDEQELTQRQLFWLEKTAMPIGVIGFPFIHAFVVALQYLEKKTANRPVTDREWNKADDVTPRK